MWTRTKNSFTDKWVEYLNNNGGFVSDTFPWSDLLGVVPEDEFSTDGIIITAIYSDGSREVLDISNLVLSGYNMEETGSQTVGISYGNQTITFEINVKESSSVEPLDSTAPEQNNNKGFTTGAIVGIVLGLIIVIGISIFVISWFAIRKKRLNK